MTDIATAPQLPQATPSSSSSSSSSAAPSPSNINECDIITASETRSSPADEVTGDEPTSTPEESEKTEPENTPPPKPAFAWGKPTNAVSTAKDTAVDANTKTAPPAAKKSLLDIMQEEQELSKAQQEASQAQQAQKEEDELMKQAIQQSMAMQQQEEDDLALALRLSQLDAGIDMADTPTPAANKNLKPAPVSIEPSLNLKQVAPVSNESNHLNLKQAPVAENPSKVAAAAASLPETVASSTARASESAASMPAAAAASANDTSAINGGGGGGGGGLSEEELASIQLAIQQADDEDMQKSLQVALQLEMENETMRKQQQEAANRQRQNQKQNQGNVRVITREEYLLEQQGPKMKKDHGPDYNDEAAFYRQQQQQAQAGGFRINAQHDNPNWTRLDGFVVGPNDEIRTKHDIELQGQANAHRLHLDQFDDDDGDDDEYDQFEGGATRGRNKMRVGNKAYNSFQQTMKKKTVKGVASHGQGRANTDTEKTKEGALDSHVRLLIGKTINQDWIDEFHGCIKEGKEAMVYHATSGSTADKEMGVGQVAGADLEGATTKVGDFETGKYDVAVKVFKRIEQFRNRGQYVQGDPRYHTQAFSHSSGRAQLEIWAEKEYRNLIRAYRVGIPVPQPLLQRENVVFLRFLGQDGWPCPQLREVKMKRKSHKWMALYQQTMKAVQTLYQDARLVHGDLSEYNLLVCPAHLLLRKSVVEEEEEEEEEKDGTIGDGSVEGGAREEEMDSKMPAASASTSKPAPTSTGMGSDTTDEKVVSFAAANTKAEKADKAETADKAEMAATEIKNRDYDPNALQIALIDFGQAVDTRHPQASELLERDLLRVRQFFVKMGLTTTLSAEAAMTFVTTKGASLLS
ncbi:MAG: hypothetical protein SGBAC_012653 [Bacillariaceae sp.]